LRRQKQLLFPLISILLCISPVCFGQAWSGILDPSRAVNWSNAGAPGGIPNRTTICATLSAGASGSQINSAIASCPAGQVVFLNAGTYSISGGINFNGHSNVTLRGAGPTQTILQFSSGLGCGGQGGDICIIDSNPSYVGSAPVQPGGSQAANWTAGYARGSTQITLSSVSGLSAGKVIILDQANDTSDTGGVFICDASNCHQNGETSSSNGRTVGGVDRNQTQIVQVTGVSGNTVSISPGLYASNWRASQSPGAWWTSRIASVGVENLTVDNSGSGSNVQSGIFVYDCDGCWIKNIISIKGNRNHIWNYQSSHLTVRDSYFYGTQGAATESYGIENFIASDVLVENNIFEQIADPIMGSGFSGGVIAYNFGINNLYRPTTAVTWNQVTYASHDAGNMFNLYEGNQFNSIDCDSIHGTGAPGNTIFRDWLTGRGYNSTSLTSNNTHAVNLYGFCRGYNVVGSVLGSPGYFNAYQATPSTGSGSCNNAIFNVGFGTANCGSGTPGNDNVALSTLLRWGNYDTVNGSVQWSSSEIPTASVPYLNGNPVPSSHTLPDSFYLSGQPAWWGSQPFPPIGPDVTGGTGPGGFAHNNPAADCYLSVLGGPVGGTGNPMAFDASKCYGGGGTTTNPPPAPPTNLNVVVQ
jgi:hypothetical protein